MEISLEMLFTILGIVIAVVTFIVTYNKTIGARKERAKTAFNEIVKIIRRNLIIDNNLPNYKEIDRIIRAKTDEHNIRLDDLPDEEDFIETVYTKIFEDEFIAPKRKTQLLTKINDLIEIETRKVIVEEPTESKRREERFTLWLISLMSVLMGMLFFSLSFYSFRDYVAINTFIPLLITLSGMILSIFIMQVFIKTKAREKTENISSIQPMLREKQKFEYFIRKKLISNGFKIEKINPIKMGNIMIMPDFYAKKNDKEYIFELRTLERRFPYYVLNRLKDMAKIIKSSNPNIILVLITKGKIIITDEARKLLDDFDYILDVATLDQLSKI